MDFKVEKFEDVAVIHVFLIRATLAKAVKFREFVNETIDNGTVKLIVDLSMCEYVDSTFLGAIVSLFKRVNSLNGDLRLVYNKEAPSLMFVLTRMDKVFKTFQNIDEAIQSYGVNRPPKLNWK
ncbi:STAS domain-containing protein [Melioribacteraceae bacterium 4301-Me]|uniref:STAS domain-containing protein n=1 Tax=Pyranulibacter aquaticus TaxID=3163344 RepID=UPI0035968E1F